MCSPQWVSDNPAAAQVLSLETKMVVALVCFKQRAVGVRAKELEEKFTQTKYME